MRPIKYILIIISIFILGAIWLLSFGTFTEFNIALFKMDGKILSTFFKYASLWAEWPIILTALLLSFYKWGKYAWIWVFGFSLEGIFIQILKHFFNAPRPVESFSYCVKHIDGITLAHYGSFPSGHTAAVSFGTGLLLWTLFAINSKQNTIISSLLIFGVVSTALSRVFLCQHHLQDVFVGGIIGAGLFFLFFRINSKIFPILSK